MNTHCLMQFRLLQTPCFPRLTTDIIGIWQRSGEGAARPAPAERGWVGRHADSLAPDPRKNFGSSNVGAALPMALVGLLLLAAGTAGGGALLRRPGAGDPLVSRRRLRCCCDNSRGDPASGCGDAGCGGGGVASKSDVWDSSTRANCWARMRMTAAECSAVLRQLSQMLRRRMRRGLRPRYMVDIGLLRWRMRRCVRLRVLALRRHGRWLRRRMRRCARLRDRVLLHCFWRRSRGRRRRLGRADSRRRSLRRSRAAAEGLWLLLMRLDAAAGVCLRSAAVEVRANLRWREGHGRDGYWNFFWM